MCLKFFQVANIISKSIDLESNSTDLETAIRTEGTMGLAKVASYIYIVKRKQIVPTPEVNRFSEAVDRLLYRELSEASGEPIRRLEEKIKKMMRPKLTPDT